MFISPGNIFVLVFISIISVILAAFVYVIYCVDTLWFFGRRVRLVRQPSGLITFAGIFVIGRFEVGWGHVSFCAVFKSGDRVVAFLLMEQKFSLVQVLRYRPEVQKYEVLGHLYPSVMVPASFVFPVPSGADWGMEIEGMAEIGGEV